MLVRESIDVFTARWAAKQLASAIGFTRLACDEIAIVVSELGTNILKYGVRGQIDLRRVDDVRHGAGIEIVAEDEGPLLTNLDLAIRDGFADHGPIDPLHQMRRGGIGAGLGAVIRFSDVFEYIPRLPKKAFRAIRYVRRRLQSSGGP